MKRTDFSQLQGIENVKRAIEIALAGFHDLTILSKPHNGNTTLAYAIRNIIMGLNARGSNLKYRYINSHKNDEIIVGYWKNNVVLYSCKILITQDPVVSIDNMTILCPKVTIDHYMNQSPAESSENVVERVFNARKISPNLLRFEAESLILLKSYCKEYDPEVAIIAKLHEVSSTIAILDKPLGKIEPEHMAEAIMYFKPIQQNYE